MKQHLLIILLIFLPLTAFCTAMVESVRATDSGKRSSRVTIILSESRAAELVTNRQNIVLRIADTKLGTSSADYRRLSHVIDYINLAQDNERVNISIRTMGEYQVSQSRDGRRIFIDIVNPAIPERPAPRAVQPSATPTPTVTPVAPVTPSEEPETPITEEFALPDSSAPAPAPTQTQKVRKVRTCPRFILDLTKIVEDNLHLAIAIFALCILLLIWLLVLAFKPKSSQPKTIKEKAFKPDKNRKLDLGLGGSTLLMDSETKARMVTKLLTEGWNQKQIARELNLSLKEIESIAKQAQFTDPS